MTIEWGGTLSKTHFDADTDDPSQARAELEAMVDRINTKLANVTLLQLSDKTGNDAGIVSGTAGTDGNLGQWGADGNLVDGPDVLDEDDMASDSASAVPTQQSVKAYSDAGDPTLDTAVDATNGGADDLTEIDFTGIKSGAKRITVHLANISLSGTNSLLIQLGDSGGIESAGYEGAMARFTDASNPDITNFASGNGINLATSTTRVSGIATFVLVDPASNTWAFNHNLGREDGAQVFIGGGRKSLSAELDRIRIASGGSDTFDSGEVNIMVE